MRRILTITEFSLILIRKCMMMNHWVLLLGQLRTENWIMLTKIELAIVKMKERIYQNRWFLIGKERGNPKNSMLHSRLRVIPIMKSGFTVRVKITHYTKGTLTFTTLNQQIRVSKHSLVIILVLFDFLPLYIVVYLISLMQPSVLNKTNIHMYRVALYL